MFIDARSVTPGSEISADVCIVGGGPAGITLAAELLGSGARVALLESGGEQVNRRTQRRLAEGDSVGYPYYRLRDMRLRAFGGNSHAWTSGGLRCRPLDPVDFEARPEIPHSGWPFGLSELEPYYRRACELMELQPSFDADDWAGRSAAPPLPLVGDTAYSTVFQFAPRDVFLRRGQRLRGAGDVTVYLNATVTDVVLHEPPSDAVSHVTVASRPGRRFSVAASLFVLAAGGTGNARLLLASNRVRPAGLGNGHDLVGRFFQEHLSVRSGTLAPTHPALLGQVDFYKGHQRRAPRWRGMLAPTNDTVRREGLLNSSFYVMPVRAVIDSPSAHALAALRRWLEFRPRPPHAAAHLATVLRDPPATMRVLRERDSYKSSPAPEVLQLKAMAEQAPNPASRVTLSPRRDRFGQPRARLDWRLTELDIRSIRGGQEAVHRALQAAGLGAVTGRLGEEPVPELLHGNEHQIGTTRMHRDPRRGVVDPHGRVHELANLYLAGPSVFPSGGYANPTLTVTALAVRLAGHLRENLRRSAGAAAPERV